MKNTVIKRLTLILALLAMVTVFAVPLASAASYSKVYGQTQDRVRVRESASTNATVVDNVVKGACVYITDSKVSGSSTFVQIKYRASDGSTATGWVCQKSGSTTYVKVLSTQQTKDKFDVSGGDLPSKRVGTFTTAQRKASVASSDNTYLKSGASGESVKSVQTKLKALGLYAGEITGNVGSKTEAAIKAFQQKYGLTPDGVAGPQTLAKIDAVYAQSGGSSSGSGSSLKLGSQGTAVRNLQQDLTTLGYYWAEITGNFGAKTETAVRRFQEENGMTADGVVGTKTLNAIAAAIARKGGTSASSSNSGSALKLNSKGTRVTQLQQDLKQLGFYYAEITGNFGEKTEAAVKKFQESRGLTVNGVAGTSTLNAIASAITKAGGSTSGSTGGVMRLGSTGDDVRALQQNLTILGYYYGDVTGRYGSLTQQAVKKFQKAKGMTDDGVAGTTTVNAIVSAVRSSGSTPASGSGSAATGTLREGDSGTAVKELQTMLKKLNYYYGDITGSFGSLTRQAVRKFQDDNDLTVDGIAGTSTLNKLRAMTGGTVSTGGSSGTTVTTANSYGRIKKDNVYLRASYSTSSASKASLGQGTLVRISKTYTSAGVKWYYISVNMGSYVHNGYVRSDMIDVITEGEYNSSGGNSGNNYGDHEVLGMIKVTGDNVALRYEPNIYADRVDVANIGDTFYYIDTNPGWFQTRAGYWISSSYAKVMSDDEINNSTPTDENTKYYYGDGRENNAVIKEIQQALKDLGYYGAEITGRFGGKTEDAVKGFQSDHGLTADGVVGPATLRAIRSAISGTAAANARYDTVIYNPYWPTYYTKVRDQGLKTGSNGATLTDIATGITFTIHVQSAGSRHVDAEPLTAADTAKLCQIYNRASAANLPYTRRGMVLTVNNMQFVCSIYPEGHGQEDITNNNYPGQFCIHFNGSTNNTTGNGSVSESENHQAIIKKAKATLEGMTTKDAAGNTVKIQVLDKPATW